ncbi:hypothetical protein ACO2Q3_20560 [Caulobacter sp. KR2-114]|uniref:hypothetical protein n=1 Tax=Caulobacter sp. KR2-114 TaxID=3400912 RepID=UPI003C0E34A8
MTFKAKLLTVLGAALVATPLAASAQGWGDYGGDWRDRPSFAGYPQFQNEKAHIRGEIREGLREGWLDRDQAGDLLRRLQWVQRREAREFGEHGWNLPYWDRQQIQTSLDQIDRAVDQARDRGDADDGGWR